MSSCLIFEAHTIQFIFHGVIIDFTETDTSRNTNVGHKENIWVEEQGEYDDVKCHLICFLSFHGLLGNPYAILYTQALCVSYLGGGGG
jgi:hypothetical protein